MVEIIEPYVSDPYVWDVILGQLDQKSQINLSSAFPQLRKRIRSIKSRKIDGSSLDLYLNLQTLDCCQHSQFNSLLNHLVNLTTLDCSLCSGLTQIDQLVNLTTLSCSGCSGLTKLDHLINLKNIYH